MYKLIALDMDGTLLNEKKKISENTFKSIKKAMNRGIKVILATGRPLKGITSYLKELDLDKNNHYSISYNGALVQNNTTGEILSSNVLHYNDVQYLYKLSEELNVNRHVITKDSIISPKHTYYTGRESSICNIPVQLIDFPDIDSSTEVIKFMFADDSKVLDKATQKIPAEVYENFTVVRSTPHYLEFLHPNANKGAAVDAIAKKFGIKAHEVICVGDAGNDIHMIKYAGLGVAMNNAFDEIKEIADYVTKSNSEDGVAHVINKFILNEKKL